MNSSVDGLQFERYAEAGVQFFLGNGVEVRNCAFQDLYHGVKDDVAQGTAPHVFENNLFNATFATAMRVAVDNVVVQDNTFTNIALVSGMGETFYGYSALIAYGDNALIQRNRFDRVGYCGIDVKSNNGLVTHNFITGALATLNDGAGIFFDDSDGLLIEENIITDAEGNLNGAYTGAFPIAIGIYVNEEAISNTSVRSNTVAHGAAGIHVDHRIGNSGNVFANNTLFDNETAFSITDYSNRLAGDPDEDPPLGEVDNEFYQASYDTKYTGNIMYAIREDQRCMEQDHPYAWSYAGLVDYGDFSGNFYFNPYNSVPIYLRERYTSNNGTYLPRSLDQWQAMWHAQAEDATSIISPVHRPSYVDIGQDGPLIVNTGFALGGDSWPLAGCSVLDLVEPGFVGGVLRDQGNADCEWIRPTTTTASDPGVYRLSFKIKAEGSCAVDVRIQEGANAPLAKSIAIGPLPRTITRYFEVPGPGTPDLRPMIRKVDHFGRVFNANGSGPDILLDDVTLQRRLVQAVDPTLDNILLYNNNIVEGPQAFSLPAGCWADVHGQVYTGNVEVAWFQSLVLYRLDTDFDLDVTTHHITTDETWDTDRNVRGSVIVDPGQTLTVVGATVNFAASDGTTITDLVVQPGGELVVAYGGQLTSYTDCSGSAMWNGTKILGNGTTVGAGVARFESGAMVSNAFTAVLCGETDPDFPSQMNALGTGGIVQGTRASFENNRIDVFMTEHTGFDPLVMGPSFLDHCIFATTRALNDPSLHPSVHVGLFNSHNMVLTACSFTHPSTLEPTDPTRWGLGLIAINTLVQVLGEEATGDRTLFRGQFIAFEHMAFDPSKTYKVDRADFKACDRSIFTVATDGQRITNCTFDVPDMESTADAAYGTYMYGSSGFEFEENVFQGHGATNSYPEVGSIFQSCGPEFNEFYNNRFDGFQGNSPAGLSAGTIIEGVNSGPNGENGLKIKCNDYSGSAQNAFDVAFTVIPSQPAVTLGGAQGMLGDATKPAGNTFALSCGGNEEQHLFVGVGAALNAVNYWHHNPQIGVVELIPECTLAPVALNPAFVPYIKETACPTLLSGGVVIDDELAVAEEAEDEFVVLKDVYSNWKDGGNTFGLLDFVTDPANSSYAVRNRLMLVAPKVGREVWKEVFARTPAMNPWHLAQALLANSPLQKDVIAMMVAHDIDEFYKALVLNGQGSGVSMHSIYESEIAHFYGRKSGALHDATARVLFGQEPAAKATNVLSALGSIYLSTSAEAKLALQLAQQDLAAARTTVNAQLAAAPTNGYWQLQDLSLAQREAGNALAALDGQGVAQLQSIAANEKEGAPEAYAWLALLGQPIAEDITLPNLDPKRLQPEGAMRTVGAAPMLTAYPNPANGPVYLVYQVPEGVEKADVRMHDSAGRLVFQQSMAPKNGIIEVAAAQLATGLHLATLHFDGIAVGTAKVNVTK